ncbi:MAG: hypothetical protein IPO62_01200 [Saprospiraceae bacterium]|nr:hypothetical protein [Saprospiraceae bacterium]MBK9629680.1 hypothetical protein [Saprospiraceae bacterium]
MKNLILILFLLFEINVVAQKKIIYINDILEVITRQQFKARLTNYDYCISFDLDTLIVNVRVTRIREGKISEKYLQEIKNNITLTTGSPISDEVKLVLNFYPGIDKCNTASETNDLQLIERYLKYSEEIKKIQNVKQFFVYKSIEGTESYGPHIKWIPDVNQTIEKLFFKIPFPCESYVIIDKDGNYYCYKGEYNIDEIIPKLIMETNSIHR